MINSEISLFSAILKQLSENEAQNSNRAVVILEKGKPPVFHCRFY